jgi:hypothetical protein
VIDEGERTVKVQGLGKVHLSTIEVTSPRIMPWLRRVAYR